MLNFNELVFEYNLFSIGNICADLIDFRNKILNS